MRVRLLRTIFAVITTIVLICIPQASFAGAGHGGGGGFHGGGGGFGGGFHGGGGYGGGFHGGGSAFHGSPGWGGHPGWGWGNGWSGGWGWHGGWGWPAGWGWRGWGYPGYGWGWGFGISIGWGGYWPSYPYAYGYPYYYPYYPYYPYYAPYGYPPQDPGRYNQSPQNPNDNPQRQNSQDYRPQHYPNTDIVTIKAPKPTPVSNYRAVAANRTVAGTGTAPRQQVQNIIRALEAMPPEARRRQIESGRYSNLAPEEQELLKRVGETSTVATNLR